jgi:superfamily II DNA or RNA helicase
MMTNPHLFKLRDYQEEAINAVEREWASGVQRTALVLPTGAGKTVVASHIIHREHERGGRTVFLAHRGELLEQCADKLRQVAPGLSVGIVKGAMNNFRAEVVVASVQTLMRDKRMRQAALKNATLVIVDEAHRSGAAGYLKVLEELGCFPKWNPAEVQCECKAGVDLPCLPPEPCKQRQFPHPTGTTRALALSATLIRSDGMLAKVWESVAHKVEISQGIAEGWLTDVRGRAVPVDGLDLSAVRVQGSGENRDFSDSSLASVLEATNATEVIAEAYAKHAVLADGTYRQGVVFCPSVALAQEQAEALSALGIPSEAVWGNLNAADRARVLGNLKSGRTTVVTNVGVLVEGFDHPPISCVVIARPTKSRVLYVQAIGRGMRPSPGKSDCLVLDVVGASAYSGNKLATVADLTPATPKDGESIEEATQREALEDQLAQEEKLAELAELAAQAEKSRLRRGPLHLEEIDLLDRSWVRWQTTDAGLAFVACGESTWLLWPDPERRGAWMLLEVDEKGSRTLSQPVTGLTVAEAQERVSTVLTAAQSATLARRNASWRRGKPSEKQALMARRLGMPDGVELTKGRCADWINAKMVGRRWDAEYLRATGRTAEDVA